jgi:hypothetical protein
MQVIESGDQSSDGVLKQGDTGADTGGGSSAGTGKADDQRLGDGKPQAADVGTGKGIQPSTLDTPIATFTTEKGSTYELFPDATTTRNRAPRDDNEVSGPQPRSSKTIFMSTKAVNDWGPLFQNTEVPVQLVPLADNKAKLVHLKNYGPKKLATMRQEYLILQRPPKWVYTPLKSLTQLILTEETYILATRSYR